MHRLLLVVSVLAIGTGAPSGATCQESAQLDRFHRLLGESRLPDRGSERLALARAIEVEARRALEASPGEAELQWMIISAMAFQVDDESTRRKVTITRAIVDELALLGEMSPDHPGYHHGMGRLHAGVMRISPILRWFAHRIVSGDALRGASWEGAEEHFRRARELEPRSFHHRAELGLVLMDVGRAAEGRQELKGVLDRPAEDILERLIQERARTLLSDG